MWPFTKKESGPSQGVPEPILCSQVDITERFDDNLSLTPAEWIATIPLNSRTADPPSMGLPPRDASDEDVYRIASGLSELRESIPIPGERYCQKLWTGGS